MPLPGSFLDVSEFRTRTVMPNADVDELELRAPGFLGSRLIAWTSYLEARLRKRYTIPF